MDKSAADGGDNRRLYNVSGLDCSGFQVPSSKFQVQKFTVLWVLIRILSLKTMCELYLFNEEIR